MTIEQVPLKLTKAHSLISQRTTNSSYSYLYGIEEDITLLSSGKFDIYKVINQDSTVAYFQLYDILAFVSFGWAAPTKNDDHSNLAPSQHPDKKRVRLNNYLYTQESNIVSSIDILDSDLNILDTIWELEGNTTGPLKEALSSLYTN